MLRLPKHLELSVKAYVEDISQRHGCNTNTYAFYSFRFNSYPYIIGFWVWMPLPGSPSLGEIIAQGKANLQAPWLGLLAFITLSLQLSLLVFVGEAVRDAFDPRKVT